jgi:hypothetical protein
MTFHPSQHGKPTDRPIRMWLALFLVLLLLAISLVVSAAPESAKSILSSGVGWSGNIREFETRDLGHWRSGRWVRTVHEGRGGWWWVIDDTWYPYAQVSYPYPDPYTPEPYKQPDVIGATLIGEMPARTFYWYYCDAANEFYPYVITCEHGWTRVRAPQQ